MYFSPEYFTENTSPLKPGKPKKPPKSVIEMQMKSPWHMKSILLLIRHGNRMWHRKVLMPSIKVGFPKWSGAKQKFLFASVTLLNHCIFSNNVIQLMGCCLATEAIFFMVQTCLLTIRKAFSVSCPQCLASLYLPRLQINSMNGKCQLCVYVLLLPRHEDPWARTNLAMQGCITNTWLLWLCSDIWSKDHWS